MQCRSANLSDKAKLLVLSAFVVLAVGTAKNLLVSERSGLLAPTSLIEADAGLYARMSN